MKVASRIPISGAEAIHVATAAPSGGMVRPNTGFGMIAAMRPKPRRLATLPKAVATQNLPPSVARTDGGLIGER